VLDKLELSASVKSLTLELKAERLSILDLEEQVQVMLADFLGVVKHMEVHLLTGSKRASSGFDLEDLLLQDFLLESLLWAWSAGVSPGLNVDLGVIGHLEVPIGLNSTNVLKGKSDTSRLRSILDW